METIAETLEAKLHAWKPETSQKVRALVAEIIQLADDDMLDIARSRGVEQEVLDLRYRILFKKRGSDIGDRCQRK